MTQNRQTHVWPSFQARDADAMLAFLTGTLGFVERAVHRDGDTIAHAEVGWPDGGGVMFGSHKPGNDWAREPGTAGVYLLTSDIDAVYERISGAGADVLQALADTEYGSREFIVRDPEGNLWSIGTYAGASGAPGEAPAG